jgi:hypothetical protein
LSQTIRLGFPEGGLQLRPLPMTGQKDQTVPGKVKINRLKNGELTLMPKVKIVNMSFASSAKINCQNAVCTPYPILPV